MSEHRALGTLVHFIPVPFLHSGERREGKRGGAQYVWSGLHVTGVMARRYTTLREVSGTSRRYYSYTNLNGTKLQGEE
jgi:hypothetical protein